MTETDIWKTITGLGIELHPDRIMALSKIIANIGSIDDFEKAIGAFGTEDHRTLLAELVKVWRQNNDLTPLEVAAALRSSSYTDSIARGRENVQLVWSGPDTKMVPIRRTEQVLLEIIKAGSCELFFVSFVVYEVPSILDALKSTMARGTKLSMLIESSADSGGKISFDSIAKMKRVLPDACLYIWTPSKRERNGSGVFGAVHAKCVVADRDIAFITSANLTPAAIDRNMELGVLFRGGDIPDKLSRHFNALIATGTIEPA